MVHLNKKENISPPTLTSITGRDETNRQVHMKGFGGRRALRMRPEHNQIRSNPSRAN
jgi:hypothetical protein